LAAEQGVLMPTLRQAYLDFRGHLYESKDIDTEPFEKIEGFPVLRDTLASLLSRSENGFDVPIALRADRKPIHVRFRRPVPGSASTWLYSDDGTLLSIGFLFTGIDRNEDEAAARATRALFAKLAEADKSQPVDELMTIAERPLLALVPMVAGGASPDADSFLSTLQLALAIVFFDAALWRESEDDDEPGGDDDGDVEDQP
jgi:hypothetical protein